MGPAAMELGMLGNSAGRFAAAEMQNEALFCITGSIHWVHLLRSSPTFKHLNTISLICIRCIPPITSRHDSANRNRVKFG